MRLKFHPEHFEEATKTLRLSPAQAKLLHRRVTVIIKEVNEHDELTKLLPDRAMRKQALEDLIKALAICIKLIGNERAPMASLLRQEVLPTLGPLLSGAGFDRLGAAHSPPDLTRLAEQERHRLREGEVMALMEAAMSSHRAMVAQEAGPKLITNLFTLMKAPAERQLRIEKSNRGGRPAEIHRDYVVDQLTDLHQELFGRPATTSRASLDFYSLVLAVMSTKAGGLGHAVRKALKRRSNSAKTPG